MASLVSGYEYDIFISYRQKDNKGDRWVSEFVEALKTELEATFKEDVSVYFDINMHDGLLETDDVGASLTEKLKCLVFIPIVSRTYCDPKSFAWQHEFKAFVEQASQDRFGLKVKLSNGNVSGRVLPVRIHELDQGDAHLCESLMEGIPRGVEFIYKSPGVNRPLHANEDHPRDNLNRTYYRDQINKVANAIDDIIRSIRLSENEHVRSVTDRQPGKKNPQDSLRIRKYLFPKFRKRSLAFLSLALVAILAGVFLYATLYLRLREKTVAVLPLRISNNDTSLKNEADYFTEAVNSKLNMIKSISVKPIISTLQFKNSQKSLEEIGKALRSNYLLDGNIRRDGKDVKIWLELSASRKKKMLWSKTYFWDKNLVNQVTKEIVMVIANNLDHELTRIEENLISAEPSRYADANMNFMSANAMLKSAWSYVNYGDKMLDSVSYTSTIKKYDNAIEEDPLFAVAYANRAIAISWGYYDHRLDSSYLGKCRNDIDKALKIKPDLAEAQIALGFYYYYCILDLDKALFHFSRAAAMLPGEYEPLYYQSLVYRRMGDWNEVRRLNSKVAGMNPQEALFLTNIGLTYNHLHNFDSAIIFHQKAIDQMPGWSAGYKNKLQSLLMKTGQTDAVRDLLEESVRMTGDNMLEDRININIYEGKLDEAFSLALKSGSADFLEGNNKFLCLGQIKRLMNEQDRARAYFDSALAAVVPELKADPGSCFLHAMAGIAYAGLGKDIKAVREGELAVRLAEKNKMQESEMKFNLATIYVMIGDYYNAASLLAYLINNPSEISQKFLWLDPVWKPVLEKKELRKMLRKGYNS